MRYLPEQAERKIKTTRVGRLIIKRRRDDTLRKVEIIERYDTRWFPSLETYDDTTTQPQRMTA
jgi:hypothetical protein